MRGVQLGLGTVGLGREWGARDPYVPPESAAYKLLETAIEAGIRFFDTAPAYGLSEERLGRFLGSLDRSTLAEVLIATKCGEHFDPETGTTRVDHGSEALSASIERSLDLLPHVSVLQLHKPTPELVSDTRVLELMAGYREAIPRLGISVTDSETGLRATRCDVFEVIQVPFGPSRAEMLPTLRSAAESGRSVIVSRVFGTGSYLPGGPGQAESRSHAILAAFRHVLSQSFDGVVLVGTKNPRHLLENVELFHRASAELSGS